MKEKILQDHGVKILQGNEACALGALAADCLFFAGYPITPASEISEYLSKAMYLHGGSFMQMEDELASICAIIGARWGGARSMTATSGPGFSLMQEGIGYAVVSETPIVIIDVQRGGPSTGQPTAASQHDILQSRFGSHGDYELIALCPSTVQEAFDFTVRAFNLADQYRVPVIVLTDEIVGHMREKVVVPEKVELFEEHCVDCHRRYYQPDVDQIPPRIQFYQGHHVLVDGQLHDERGIRAGHIPTVSAAAVNHYCNKIRSNCSDICSTSNYFLDGAEVVVVAYGSVSRSALSAVRQARDQGINAGLLKINTVWPSPEEDIVAACLPARKVIVPEMNVGQYAREIERLVGRDKVLRLPSLGGELHHPSVIFRKISEV